MLPGSIFRWLVSEPVLPAGLHSISILGFMEVFFLLFVFVWFFNVGLFVVVFFFSTVC